MMNFKRLLNKVGVGKITFYLCLLFSLVVAVKYLRSHSSRRQPGHLNKYLRFNEEYRVETNLTRPEVSRLRLQLDKWNENQRILNWKRYGPVRADTTVVAIQVHRDANRLQYLIISLAQVHFIQNVLLIFSHSYYNEALNDLVRNVTFCKVMQVFYPHSLQLHPGRSAGVAPDESQNPGTLNSRQSYFERDSRGRAPEHKRHWWWKANLIFENMEWSYKYKGIVIFLEEDSYVLPDMLYVLGYAERSLASLPAVDVVALGGPHGTHSDYNVFTVDTWRPPYDRGLAFNKTTWKRILTLSSQFCMYDDLSWSYSLLHLFGKFVRGRAEMVASLSPRVMSTRSYPSGKIAVESISNQLDDEKMFPVRMKAVMLYSQLGRVDREVKTPRGNGGWNDIRQHLLCLDPLMSTYREEREEESTSSPVFT